jgi:hypothetical protein
VEAADANDMITIRDDVLDCEKPVGSDELLSFLQLRDQTKPIKSSQNLIRILIGTDLHSVVRASQC